MLSVIREQAWLADWPAGVVSGGIILDMLECLSQTGDADDYKLVVWLLWQYNEPFGIIERLDGLVVTKEEDRYVIFHALAYYLS
jgi:hypothetical protein